MAEIWPLVIAWCGFGGAWLLVAGPMFQAAIELEEEQLSRDDVVAASRDVPQPPRVSAWWWLLPPVAYVLNRRRNHAYQTAVFSALTPEFRERWVSFSNKAAGWLFVAGGAFLIAIKETWELVEEYAWPHGLVLALVLIMAAVVTGHTVLRVRGTHRMLATGDAHG